VLLGWICVSIDAGAGIEQVKKQVNVCTLIPIAYASKAQLSNSFPSYVLLAHFFASFNAL
jgi:hypothetical protein